ncbi:unnamed protein product [Brassicogethes aeneus]|uniref:DNA repair protein RAD50 n=1 Tax=Brassicogethes aeneus TaxID=1431903 RepID=A0A9P0APQ7_BRAAE|nr:unnamed protein product [Brassicogethes aeneus]
MEEQMILQQDLQEGRHLEEKKAENETNLNNANICIEELEAREKKLKGEYDAAYCEKEATVRNNKQIAKEENDKVNQSKQKIEDLEKLQDEIDNYCLRNNEDRLKKENEKLDRLQVEEQEALQDNILLREKQVQEKELEFQIDKQKIQIGHHNYKEEKSNLLNEEEKILQEINNIKGEKDAIAKHVEGYKNEQEKPTNKNAYKEYKRKLFEYHIEKNLNCVLQKFAIVLEKSILRFHKDRMAHINKAIRELWRAIYRGNDIDHSEIKTENDIGTEKKRSYQYKVVQVKKGVEIDMRTRCSAGQRVLASLVIRMALAETFSTHCGILALDEPTTNLDRQNILSLSDALVGLIDSRKDEKNFQLLIITHDEEFLNTLTRVQSIPHYWKVSRNNEGFSVINKVSM